MSLKGKAISGVLWTFSQQAGVQVVNFVVQIVLARLLLPEMFGIIALLQVFIAIGNALLDGGMTSSLIRSQSLEDDDYSTVFIMNLGTSLVIYLFLFGLSPLVSNFYEQPILTSVIRVYTLSFIIQALVAVQTTRLTKEMNFKLQMVMQIPSVIIGGIVGIVLAKLGYGVWSLVYLNLTRTAIFMILHWIYSDWKPKLAFNVNKFKTHFSFGYKLTFSSLITSLYYNLYALIIGKFFSASQLGFFQQANTLSLFPMSNLSTALLKVTYPMFSSLSEDDVKLRSAYHKITLVVFFICTPLMMCLALCAEPIFKLVLTDKWLPAVPYFQVLSLSYIIYPFSMYNVTIMPAKGKTNLHLKAEVIKKGVSVVVLVVSLIIFRSVWSIIYSAAFSVIFQGFVNSYFAGKLMKYSIKDQLSSFVPSLLIGTSVLFLTHLLFSKFEFLRYDSLLIIIVVKSTVYIISYLLISYIIKSHALKETGNILINLIQKSRN